MRDCSQFTCVLYQTCMYYTFGCNIDDRKLNEKWQCHYKETCVVCGLNKICNKAEKVKKEKENKHGQGQNV